MNEIKWFKRPGRPSKRHGGHDVRATASVYDSWRMRTRTYVKCECGSVLSGNGSEGGYYSWVKHARRKGVAL